MPNHMPSRAKIKLVVPAILLMLAACQPVATSTSNASAAAEGAPGDTGETAAYTGITAQETVRFTGTEPFWGGQVAGTTLTYSTPENHQGDAITVTRFAGRNGVSWSGTWQDKPFRMAVSEAPCSDGMSDRA